LVDKKKALGLGITWVIMGVLVNGSGNYFITTAGMVFIGLYFCVKE